MKKVKLSRYAKALMNAATPTAAELLVRNNSYHIRAQIESPEKWYWQEALRLVKQTIRGDDKTLDVGCGFGGFSYGLQTAGIRNVYSTDINRDQLICAEAALRQCGLVPNIIYDGLTNISLRFRVICAFDFLYALKREGFIEIILQMAKLLEPGGLLIFTMATPEATALARPRAMRLTESEIIEICRGLGLMVQQIERRPPRIPLFVFRKPVGKDLSVAPPSSMLYLAALKQAAGNEKRYVLEKTNAYHLRATLDSPEKWYWREGLEILMNTLSQTDPVLDVACGVAGFSYGVRACGLFPKLYSTDINHEYLKIAEKALALCGMEPNIIYDDLETIGMKFKGVSMFDTLFLIPRDQTFAMISRLANVVERGGVVMFTMATLEPSKMRNPKAVRIPENEIMDGAESCGLSPYTIRRQPNRLPLFAFKKK